MLFRSFADEMAKIATFDKLFMEGVKGGLIEVVGEDEKGKKLYKLTPKGDRQVQYIHDRLRER